ncbi:MAG TPA: MotA/TolQ/ExbB proton channel family protein [Candidatus Polarisedimenticolia bacterium]|jgi:biopolymer transport protein ExbB/biopolymer transport protein TolQ|nr:MotA/TolQ/ExbB proton channel family protein [Candidatus Polarisedimenticolia bacterium]
MTGHTFLDIWNQMGYLAKGVVIFLIAMSIYSLAIFIERLMYYRASKKQSIDYLPIATKALREGNYAAAVEAAKRYNKSHLAKVLAAGLQQFLFEKEDQPAHDAVESVRLAVERAAALTTAEMKRGIGGLATIGSTAPFVGLFGTVFGIINAFQGMAQSGSGGIGAVSAGIAEALITTGVGIGVAIVAVWVFNYFTGQIEFFGIEMANSGSELIDFFLKRQGQGTTHGNDGQR